MDSSIDLTRIGEKGFARLVHAILWKALGAGVTLNPTVGVDGGKDAYYSGDTPSDGPFQGASGEFIFQYKFSSQPIDKARSAVVGKFAAEIEKVMGEYGHEPGFYIYVTNVLLTAGNKESLAEGYMDAKTKYNIGNLLVWDYTTIAAMIEGDSELARSADIPTLAEVWRVLNDLQAKVTSLNLASQQNKQEAAAELVAAYIAANSLTGAQDQQASANNVVAQNQAVKDDLLSLERLGNAVSNLLAEHPIESNKLKKTIKRFNELLDSDELPATSDSDAMVTALQAWTAIETLDRADLISLDECGANIHPSLKDGMGMVLAFRVFQWYFKTHDSQPGFHQRKYVPGRYEIEQISRIALAYKSLTTLDLHDVERRLLHSSGVTLFARSDCGHPLLLASFEGETNRIYIWDLESNSYQPKAMLGGVTDSVRDLKVLRNLVEGRVLISGLTSRAVYIWDPFANHLPVRVFRLPDRYIYSLTGYGVGPSLSGELCVMAQPLYANEIIAWKFDDPQSPAFLRLPSKTNSSAMLLTAGIDQHSLVFFFQRSEGIGSLVSVANELPALELTPFRDFFSTKPFKDIVGMPVSCHHVAVSTARHLAAVVVSNAIHIVDYTNPTHSHVIGQEEQRFHQCSFVQHDSDIYLLAWCLYQHHYPKGNQVHFFQLNDLIPCRKQAWHQGSSDISAATSVSVATQLFIFFYPFGSRTIYKTSFGPGSTTQPCFQFDSTMTLIELAGG